MTRHYVSKRVTLFESMCLFLGSSSRPGQGLHWSRHSPFCIASRICSKHLLPVETQNKEKRHGRYDDKSKIISIMKERFNTIQTQVIKIIDRFECTKGLGVKEGRLTLISNIIRKNLNIPCAALMGSNVAQGIADEEFCEATLGEENMMSILYEVFNGCMIWK